MQRFIEKRNSCIAEFIKIVYKSAEKQNLVLEDICLSDSPVDGNLKAGAFLVN